MKVKCRQRMMPTKGFPYHSPLRTLLQCRLESGSCRRTVIDDEYTDQANSSRCRNARVATEPPSLFMRLGRSKPYPEDLTGARIGRYEMRIAVPPRELDPAEAAIVEIREG
jgi:hypothetical protein